jgi:penicillin-binding protein 1C
VRLRDALGGSLNVPAVWTLSQVGVAPFLDRLHALGFDSLTRAPDDYGTALALGDGEVTLLQLAGAYATLARGGTWRPVRVVRSAPETEERRVIDAAAAAQITDVLSDPRARVASFGEGDVLRFPFDVAAKTGTSQGYRDNWAVGFTSAVTVAAWVGNFDGSPMGHVSGITGAGPLFHAVMLAAMRGREARSLRMGDAQFERVTVCALSGERAGHDCHHTVVERMTHDRAASLAPCSMHVRGAETLPAEYGAWVAAAAADREEGSAVRASSAPLHIDSPVDGDAFFLVPDRPASLQAIDVRVAAPDRAGSVDILIDGAPVATLRASRAPYVFSWPLAAGSHEIVARSGSSRSPPVRVRVD